MSHDLSLSPAGRIYFEHPESVENAALRAAFAESSGSGLILLAGKPAGALLPPTAEYWRGFARRLFSALCSLGETTPATWAAVPPPAEEVLIELAAAAPLMRGIEYLSPAVLRQLWLELATLVSQRAASWKAGAPAYLHHVDPLFHQLGRVTFHLAENKANPDRPFAFLATFTHRISDRAKVAHLPLAEALRAFAGARDAEQLKSLLAPVERAAESSELARELLNTKALFSPQSWSVRQAYRFLQEIPKLETAGVVVRMPDWWRQRRPARPQVQVQIGKKAPSTMGLDAMLDFSANLTLEGEELTAAERRQLLAATDGLVLLRGQWVEVNQTRLQQTLAHWQDLQSRHPDGLDFIEGMRLLAGTSLERDSAAEPESVGWSTTVAGDWLRQTLAEMRQPTADAACQPGRDLQATLRHYQIDGVQWLWFMNKLGLGACLADDMGLGKTIQVIDLLLQQRRAAGKQRLPPALIVVPASLLGNWRQELTQFAPTLRWRILHRSECDANSLRALAEDPLQALSDCDVVFTTYAMVRRLEWLSGINWSLVVLDEAQAIKSGGAAITKSVKKLKARGRLALTGTPVENQLGDLWSLFDFICPGLLGSATVFKNYIKRLNSKQDPQAYAALRRLIRPYILRRLKTDPTIVPDLPLKTELRTECGLSKQQAVLYEQAVTELKERLEDSDGIARRGLVLAMLMKLKQICNHPAAYLQNDRYVPAESGKFQRLQLLCEPLVARQERALIFTQFQSLTEPLAEYLAEVFGRPGLVLHGGTPVKRRGELVKTFQAEDGPPFFVISLKAGGSGLNLTAASHVIHFDRWWNPAVENQATDRAFRIGQKRNVLVHKFVCRGTIEERIDALIASKQALADQVLAADEQVATRLSEMTDDELLRFVALDVQQAMDDE